MRREERRGEEKREERRRKREGRRERKGERRVDDPGPKFLELCRARGCRLAVHVSRVCIRVRGSFQVFVNFDK